MKFLRGSVGSVHVHFGYIILNSNEERAVRNPKSKIFFMIYSLLSCLLRIRFTIYTYFTLVKVAKLHPVSSWLPRREDCFLRVSFEARYRFV